MQGKEKGSRGYIGRQKKKYGIISGFFFVLVAAFFITGLVLCKTRNNILTVMAILMVLPAAKFAVDLIMVLPYRSVTQELYERLENADSRFLHRYECIFTSKEKSVYVPALVITDHTICAYAPDTKADIAKFEADLRDYIKAAKLTVSVTVIGDEERFIKKVEYMSGSREAKPDQNEKDRMQRIWDSARCMCL